MIPRFGKGQDSYIYLWTGFSWCNKKAATRAAIKSAELLQIPLRLTAEYVDPYLPLYRYG